MLRGTTGSGSEAPSARVVNPGTTAVAVLISRSRLLTPWVDSFHRLPMPCVDSLRRWDTEEPPPRVSPPFRSVLSMLMANRIEFRPEERSRNREAEEIHHKSVYLNQMRLLNFFKVLCKIFWAHSKTGQSKINSGLFFKRGKKLWHKISGIYS